MLTDVTEVNLTPDFAWVWWDCDAKAWVIECWACNLAPSTITPWLPDNVIHATLLAAAERHNQEHHPAATSKIGGTP